MRKGEKTLMVECERVEDKTWEIAENWNKLNPAIKEKRKFKKILES